MQDIDGQHVYSATDLVGYLACEHLTNLDRAVLAGALDRPHRVDPELDVIRRRGFQHEQRYLDSLASDGRAIAVISPDGYPVDSGVAQLRAATAATVEAMRRGDVVVYQATFFDERWRGHADFLLRVDRPSDFGPWSYEIVDTKLARHVKASALLQICSYVEQLTRIQGVEPEWMHVALGGAVSDPARFRVSEYMAYYRAVKARFEAAVRDLAPATNPPLTTYPEPVDHCDVCKWAPDCDARRRADDHLSLVAGISSHQRRALGDRAIGTLEELASLTLPVVPPVAGIGRESFERIQKQARIQADGRRDRTTIYELLRPVVPEQGLARLPAPSPGDLFFDIEGDPYAMDDGLEYLFGIIEPGAAGEAGAPVFHAFWGTDRAGEKRAFEATIDLIMDRLARDPEMHVYHFAPYEPTAVKRLMGRHATREEQVDRLLRGGVFVDLFGVVRQSLRASVESYSIKKLEALYGFSREIDLRDAGSSIVAFERWIELGDEAARADDPEILSRIEAYNRDDCVSTWWLRNWLEDRRADLERTDAIAIPRPQPKEDGPRPDLAAALARVEALAGRLTVGIPADPSERTGDEQGRWLLAQLLSWHRREEKSFWWNHYRLMNDLTDEERVEDRDALGDLTYEGVIADEGAFQVHRYRFPPQESEVRTGTEHKDPATSASTGRILDIDLLAGHLDVRRKRDATTPHPRSLVPFGYIGTDEQKESLYRLGEWVADHEIDAPGAYRAARDLILRHPPRAGQPDGAALRDDTALESSSDAAARLAMRLDNTTLAIQGPPGSGKTSTAAQMIVDLLRAGKRVGITANSHKVIVNLLDRACKAAANAGVEVRAIQKAEKDHVSRWPSVKRADDNAHVRDALAGGDANLAAGTAWLWSRGDMTEAVDVLFVDEAGQFSLANAVAVAGAARSVVLLGDPAQLDQPLQGTHPPGAEKSSLAHVLGEASTMPPDRGLFIERTWRLHPDLCRFTSEAFYAGRLTPEPHLAVQRLNVAMTPFTAAAAMLLDGTGIRHIPVAHTGNRNESREEAEMVASLAASLVESGATWTDCEGGSRRVGWEDVLVVAPYNAQVAAIRSLLPDAARVGTVDKFQGQEAPISIYSMATSTPEDAPRGMDFLYSRNRLNVATSRAQCVSVLVCSPDLLRVRARTPEQMRLANAFAQLVEHAS